MKAKYIYHNKKLRCKITYDTLLNHVKLQVQEYRGWFLGWQNAYAYLTVSEGSWGDSVIRSSWRGGGDSEIYPKGKLNIESRVRKLFDQYFVGETDVAEA